ncbi:MAG: BamA/TamA family outer membrane protein [Ignavibacteriales bacterium]|nr:BamA/TamA family outer membrane protein [Ignavibacteriales bacterium]
MLIEIKEKQTNNFDGIIGYIPSNKPDENGFVTGLVNISLRNIFGSGRSAAIRWQKLDRNSQDLELKYLEPWFLGYPFNIAVGFNQRKQDTIYVQRKFEGAIEFLATETITASLQFAAESIIPSENLANVFTVYNSSSLQTGLNLKIDTRDDPYAPTEGILFSNTYSFSRKKINGPSQFISPDLKTNINLQRILIGLDVFYSIFSRQVVALKLNGRELQGSFFEISDLFRLGGTNSLRGYREDQFLGSRVFWSNLEYRLLLARRTYTYLFFDTGYYLVKEDDVRKIGKQEAFNVGYGLGLNVETALGVIGVSFALAKGDSFSDGKIHFGLVSEF